MNLFFMEATLIAFLIAVGVLLHVWFGGPK